MPRGAIGAPVFKNKINMEGGKYGGLADKDATTEFIFNDDIWTLFKIVK